MVFHMKQTIMKKRFLHKEVIYLVANELFSNWIILKFRHSRRYLTSGKKYLTMYIGYFGNPSWRHSRMYFTHFSKAVYWLSQGYFTCSKQSWKNYFFSQNPRKKRKNRGMRIFLLVMGDPKLHIFEIPYRDTLEGISHVSKKKQKNTFFLCKIELKCAHLGGGS